MAGTNEVDLVVKYAGEKGGGPDGQLIIDDVELEKSRDNRNRVGIGFEQTQRIERGNQTFTFSTTTYMGDAAASAIQSLESGDATTQAVYIRDDGVFSGRAEGMVWNTINVSASDGGDTTVQIDADLVGVEFDDE